MSWKKYPPVNYVAIQAFMLDQEKRMKMNNIPSLSNQEWLSSLLKKTGLTPMGVFIWSLIINLLTTIPVAIYFGAWHSSSVSKGLSSDPASLLNDDLAIPIIISYFHWIQSAGDRLLVTLLNNGILKNNKKMQAILKKNSERLQNHWTPVVAALAGLMFSIWFVVTFTQSQMPTRALLSWIMVNPAIVWVRAPMMFISIYALVIFIYDLGIIVLTLNTLFQNVIIKVEPLHPDGAGGLSAIGNFVSSLGYLLLALGIVYSTRIIVQTSIGFSSMDGIVTLIGLGLYILLSPFVFFLPLQSARNAMIASRVKLLSDISKEFNATFSEIHKLRSEKADKLEPLLKRQRQIEEIHKMVERFPVWPFNFENIRKFFSLVFIPILPALISIAMDILK